ncbi:MAG TPA: RNA polymerase sigma factor [Kofleriaceae bacterium]|nr:RNA polymerase sigma factor [Kofleriaceae bacterium]
MVEPAELAGAGVDAGLAAAFEDAEPVLAALARRMCASPADARDLVQDTFERATRQGLPPDLRSARAWLATIMHNLFIDRCRAAARRPAVEPLREGIGDAAPAGDPEPAWQKVTLDDLRAAAAQLEPPFREVYELHAFERRSYGDIAARLAIPAVTVGSRLSRARKKLRELLVARLGLEDAS